MDKLGASIKEAVQISGLSRSAIYRAAKEKRLTIRKNKGRSVVLVEELNAFLKSLPATEA